jgi:hypothetical protein
MRKLLSSGLAMFGAVSMPVSLSPVQASKPPAADHRPDPRFATLRQFFQKSGCPASEYAAVFLEVADTNGLDWRLLPSISFIETTGGKASHNNNLFGWESGRAHFASPIAGIQAVGHRLSHSDLYKGKPLDRLLALYNPNADYARKVKSVMRRIAPVQ